MSQKGMWRTGRVGHGHKRRRRKLNRKRGKNSAYKRAIWAYEHGKRDFPPRGYGEKLAHAPLEFDHKTNYVKAALLIILVFLLIKGLMK